MANLNVAYRAPVPCGVTLWNEVVTRWPDRAQNKGFVAGSGPTLWNISSHNADNNGLAHALDIGVDIEGDGSGILVSDAKALAEHLRAMGYAEWAGKRAGRLAYIIYAKQIAGDHTGWQWVPYVGLSPHWDHIHVSFSFDFAWGDSIWESTAEVYSTAPWGVGTTIVAKGGDIIPIEEEGFLMALDDNDQTELLLNVRKSVKALDGLVAELAAQAERISAIEARLKRYVDSPISAVPTKTIELKFDKAGTGQKGETSLREVAAWNAANFELVGTRVNALKPVPTDPVTEKK